MKSTPSWKSWVPVILIALVTAGLYLNSVHAPFILDDIYKIVKNPDITKLSNIRTKLVYSYKENRTFNRNDPSRPLTNLTFILNYHFGKLNPEGYHLFNILLHILNAILVFLLARKIILLVFGNDSPVIPALTGLFFAISPVNTYSVIYAYCRSDLLATLFYLLAVLFFLDTFTGKKLYLLSLLCFTLALSAKQIAITLPGIILIADYVLISNFNLKKVLEKKKYHIPFWIIFAIYLTLRYFYLGGFGDLEAKSTFSRIDYLITQPYSLIRYIQLMLIPFGLSIDHFVIPLKIGQLKTIGSFLIIISLFFAVYLSLRKKDNISKLLIMAFSWFFITISTTSSFFPTAGMLVENRAYLSGFGIYLFVIVIFFYFFDRDLLTKRKNNRVILAVICAYFTLLSVLTVRRGFIFQDDVRLWQDVVSKYPNSSRAYNNLGNLYQERGELDKAEPEFKKAIQVGPDYFVAYDNLGVLYRERGEYEKAYDVFNKVLELNPDYNVAHSNLGILYVYRKEYEKAISEFQRAIQINPDYIDAHNNLGNVYATLNQYEKAIDEFNRVLELNPDYTLARFNLGLLYEQLKQYDKSIEQFKIFLNSQTGNINALNNIARVYFLAGKYRESLATLERLLQLSPGNQAILNKMNMVRKYLK